LRMEMEMFGWREGLLILMGLAVIYFLLTLYRLLRVGKRPAGTRKEEPPIAEPVAPIAPEPEPTEALAPLAVSQSNEWNDIVDLEMLRGTASPPTPVAEVAPRATGFGEQLAEHLARADLDREVRLLRQEVNELRAELEELRAVRNISPQYAEAVALAQRGLTAQDVADRMGISLAEAELVHALSRGESNFDEGENNGAERDDREVRDSRDAGYADDYRFEPGLGYEPRRGG